MSQSHERLSDIRLSYCHSREIKEFWSSCRLYTRGVEKVWKMEVDTVKGEGTTWRVKEGKLELESVMTGQRHRSHQVRTSTRVGNKVPSLSLLKDGKGPICWVYGLKVPRGHDILRSTSETGYSRVLSPLVPLYHGVDRSPFPPPKTGNTLHCHVPVVSVGKIL